jgi:amino acid adenylation domain-containing protein
MEMAAPTLTTVPIRVTIDKDQSLLEYAKKIQQQAIDMIPHEHYGLQNIRSIQPQATNFNHILILHSENFSNADDSMVEAVDINQLGLGTSSSTKGYYTHSLVMDCTFYKDTLKLEVFYDANVVNNQQMERIVHSFEHILNQVTTGNVDLALRDIVLCSPQDHQEILEWNAIEHREMPHLIHQLVKDISTLHANLPALDGWDGNLTYGELELLSSRLASFLWQQLDFYEDVVIPICFDKSIFTVVSMLAVLKMGAAYVPIEPSYPASRLQEIVEQVDARMVLISAQYYSTFSERVDHVIVVDNSLLDSISQAPEEKLRHEHLSTPTPASRAMIIFTSGSTGKPKGVVLTHGAFSTMALALGPELRLGVHTRALQFAAYAFDVSNAEVFLTLIHGGCVCIPSHHDRMNNLAEVIVRMRINWLYLTPTGSSLLKGPNEVPCVKTLLLGGEAARKDIIDTWASNVHLVNTYGPAEGTIWPSVTTFTPESSPLYIGRGNNCYMWLVDPENHHRLMPIGAVGEIILEGPLLAAGYFNDPEKTQQAFVHDLHWASNKGKPRCFYATGDLATYNADGTMSFAGRKYFWSFDPYGK